MMIVGSLAMALGGAAGVGVAVVLILGASVASPSADDRDARRSAGLRGRILRGFFVVVLVAAVLAAIAIVQVARTI